MDQSGQNRSVKIRTAMIMMGRRLSLYLPGRRCDKILLAMELLPAMHCCGDRVGDTKYE